VSVVSHTHKHIHIHKRSIHSKRTARVQADIVVFPEGCNGWMQAVGADGIYQRNQVVAYGDFVPHVQSSPPYLNPCDSYGVDGARWGVQLHNVSCLAKKYRVVLVVNLIDLQPCSPLVDANCPPDGMCSPSCAVD